MRALLFYAHQGIWDLVLSNLVHANEENESNHDIGWKAVNTKKFGLYTEKLYACQKPRVLKKGLAPLGQPEPAVSGAEENDPLGNR